MKKKINKDWVAKAWQASKNLKPVWSDAKSKRDRTKLYKTILPKLIHVARKNGYALALHGSLTRDLDLIAVPWQKKVINAETLAIRLHQAVCKYPNTRSQLREQSQPKPHRTTYVLILGHGGAYIDLSVTPTVSPEVR
jgi:hypothetical protein